MNLIQSDTLDQQMHKQLLTVAHISHAISSSRMLSMQQQQQLVALSTDPIAYQ